MDEARLRDKLSKLDRLASDRNPNAHEREAARRKADALRARLPQRRESIDPLTERIKQAHRDQQARQRVRESETHEELIIYLSFHVQKLKPGDQLVAAELSMTFWTTADLTKQQWNVVRMYVDELKKGNNSVEVE